MRAPKSGHIICSRHLHDEGVDFACGNGYKWLHADFGCAPFYVRREHLEWLSADRYGHRQVAETLPGHRFRLKTSAAKLEYANPAYGPVTALDAALEFLGEVGLDRIAQHTHSLAAELREGARALGMRMFTPPNNPSPIVSFHHGLDHERLGRALADEGVAVTFQEDGKLLRAAVGMFNNRDDVERLLGVIGGLV
ncbi:MAG: aminotransferase class V-fold PLP-dependent enzyme [Gemmatimonadetes bacterium]|nr:aminotransferase class V-fold PLP-dependent enzyme [Gemmatimonadota bacterium]MYC90127.1 aminotransferase class V-fold PLP-dependent enzyme [Gemmatimonadota bacterium]